MLEGISVDPTNVGRLEGGSVVPTSVGIWEGGSVVPTSLLCGSTGWYFG